MIYKKLGKNRPPWMWVNDEKKAIWFENPKTCSSSIKKYAFQVYDDNKSVIKPDWQLKYKYHDKYNGYFKFGFCRNPITRICSAYNMLSTSLGPKMIFDMPKGYKTTFDVFIENIVNEIWMSDLCVKQIYFLPEYIDFIGRFENFAEDWKYVAEKCNLRSILGLFRHGGKYNYKDFFNGEQYLYDLVKEYYCEDIKNLVIVYKLFKVCYSIPMKKFIIIGSRRRDTEEDFQKVYKEFSKYYEEGDIIISGGCPKGGDCFAEIIGYRLGLNEVDGTLIIHRPVKPKNGSPKYEWVKAFYDRNTIVANEAENDTIIIACVTPDRKGGTEDTLKKVKKGKIILV